MTTCPQHGIPPESPTGARMAACYCGTTRPSNPDLAFFESNDEQSARATQACLYCHYHEVAHEKKKTENPKHLKFVCNNFTPHGAWAYDTFYCGCRGWD